MKNYIKINGVNSNTITGLMINELPPISKPEMRTLTEEIDGRDGDIITDLGYSSYDKTITIGLFGNGYDINDIIAFFNGEGTIVFSNEDDKYYNFKIINKIDYERLQKFKTASITFHCQPFKYPLEETPLEIEYEYVNGEGESITLNDTGESILKLNLKGNTSQYTTTGKNLLDTYTHRNSNASIVTFNENGSFVINGTPSQNIDITLKSNSFRLSAGTYKFTTNIGSYTTDTSKRIWLRNVVGGESGSIYVSSYYGNETATITINEDTDFNIYLVASGVTFNNALIKPMICLSTESDTWEEYTGGQPSPSPSYPQQIHVVSGDNEILVCGKNLLDRANASSNKGLTWSSGIEWETTGALSSDYTRVNVGDIYTTNYWSNVFLYDKSKNYLGVLQNNGTIAKSYEETLKTHTIPNENDIYYMRIVFKQTDENNNEDMTKANIMINKGNTSLPYQPYQSQTYPINLGELELCKIGTYQDYFTKNSGKNLVEETLEHSNLNSSGSIVGGSSEVYDLHIAKVIEGQNYTLTTQESGADIVLGFFNTKPIMSSQTYNQERVITRNTTFTAPITGYVAFRSATGYLFAMLNKGSTALPYEPYGTGQWCKYNAIGEYTFTGEENWGDWTTQDTLPYSHYLVDNLINYNNSLGIDIRGVCNRFIVKNGGISTDISLGLRQVGDSLRRIYVTTLASLSTLTLFKEWLSNNNTTLYYQNATPYLSLIEDTTLINQLDKVEKALAKQGQTNISQVNNDAPFKIYATAMKEGTNEVEVENIGNIFARPTLDIKGNGTINVYKDNTQLLQLDMSETNEIVIEDMEAYNPSTNELMNRKVIGDYSKITCPSGTCIYKVDGDLTKMTITNYTRWL